MTKYLKLLFAAAIVVGFSSCLKDKEFEDHTYGHTGVEGGKIIELGFLNSQAHIDNKAVDFEDRELNLKYVTVRLAAKDPAPEDIVVTLDTTGTNAKLDAYNDANDKNYERFPNSFYSFPNGLKVTIKKGEREGYLMVKTNAIAFDPSSTYGLAFFIANVDKPGYTVSGNFDEFITTIGAKNKYDGQYEITGTLVDANGLYKGDYGDPAGPRIYNLITVGGNTGLFYDVSWDYANYIVVSIATGGGANTGIRPQITFDPTTNKVVGMINANTPSTVVTVGSGSQFNEDDHSIDLEWTIGRWHATEHWEYIGPR